MLATKKTPRTPSPVPAPTSAVKPDAAPARPTKAPGTKLKAAKPTSPPPPCSLADWRLSVARYLATSAILDTAARFGSLSLLSPECTTMRDTSRDTIRRVAEYARLASAVNAGPIDQYRAVAGWSMGAEYPSLTPTAAVRDILRDGATAMGDWRKASRAILSPSRA